MSETSPLLQILAAFTGGLATSLTPCVYPLLPITVSLFGAREGLSRSRAFLLGLSYVGGIALTFTILGLISARFGLLFGAFLGRPEVILGLVAFFVALALYTLDILTLPVMHKVQQRASAVGGKGVPGAFLMGLASGVVAAPCVGPALAIVLAWAAASQSPLWGGVLLFSYAVGFGLLFLVLATFAGAVRLLPRSGSWLYGTKIFIAAILFALALSMAKPFLPIALVDPPHTFLLTLFAAALGTAVFAIRRAAKLLCLLAALLLAFSGFGLFSASSMISASHSELHWAKTIDEALSLAKTSGQITMVDLYADWCGACKEFDKATFSDSAVAATLANFTLARVDFTLESTEQDRIVDRYAVPGLPCLLFLRPDGTELPGTRILGFLPPDEFIPHLKRVIADASP